MGRKVKLGRGQRAELQARAADVDRLGSAGGNLGDLGSRAEANFTQTSRDVIPIIFEIPEAS